MNSWAPTLDSLRSSGTLKWSLTKDGKPLDGAWIAESDLGTSPEIERALTHAVTHNQLGYMPAKWAKGAEEACRLFQRRHGWDLDPADVALAPNVLSVLHQVIDRLTPAGSPVVVPTPAYMPFLTIPGQHGRQALQVRAVVDEGEYRLDLLGIEDAFRAGAKMLVLCNPWNPVGRVFTRQELLDLAAVVARYDVFVFSDEIHSPLVLPGFTHVPFGSLPGMGARTVTATAASKGWNIPGLSCAQRIITDANLRAKWQSFPAGPVPPVPLGALAAQVAYTDSTAWLDQFVALISDNARLVAEATADTKFRVSCPQGTYLSWWDAREFNCDNPCEMLAERAGIAVNSGCTLGEGYEKFFRFNLATPRAVLENMLQRVFTAFGV
ncbi:MAG: aminotransferase class I/II-fold pyridoxal phosphate-dependent enzyme [Actinomycetaceae bacterium]|nr:aminotransferase class I/II-fold pyridoxal phosphate-dependent enzyme [Actinomycetaceae bacterium]